MSKEIAKVLDHGYVELVQWMGTDLSPVNAARASFDKRSEQFDEKDERLTGFLLQGKGYKKHTSPFRHAAMTFECYAPMIVKNQWYKYLVGSDHEDLGSESAFRDPLFAWNESSRRYVTEEPIFYMPKWRSAPENKKQGSGDFVGHYVAQKHDANLEVAYLRGIKNYELAMADGIAPEQARLYLPAYGMYIRWWWTSSLQGVLHLLDQRSAPDAQWEFREYAAVIREFVHSKFPVATEKWELNRD